MVASKGENLITCAITSLNQNIPLKTLIGTAAQVVQHRSDEDGSNSNKNSSQRQDRPGEKAHSKNQPQHKEPTQFNDAHRVAPQNKEQVQKKERVQSGIITTA